MSAPPPSSGTFYERGEREERERDREREREREYVRGEYGMGYDRDDRGRRSPPLSGSRMGPSSGSGAGGEGMGGAWRIGETIGGIFLPPAYELKCAYAQVHIVQLGAFLCMIFEFWSSASGFAISCV